MSRSTWLPGRECRGFSFRCLSFVAVVLGTGCREAPPPAWHEEDGYRWRELVVSGDEPGFTTMPASRTGIAFQNTASDSLLLSNRILAQGAGVCLGDVDGDALVDVFLARTEGPNALYRNLGDWRFEEITARAGVAVPDRYSTGCALADLDGDGDLDLVLLATTGPNAVFLNDGTAQFTERRDLGLDPAGKGGTSVALSDVDGDGALDLYVANYKPYTPIDRIPAPERAFGRLVREVAPGRYEVVPEFQRDFKLVNRADMGGLAISMRAEPDEFYRNDGQGRLLRERVTGSRFRDAAGRSLGGEDESFALSARFADLNGDGAPDLYVVNDFEDPDRFWLNDGRGGFRLADWTAQRQTSNSGMGMDVADFDGDGRPDFFETDMLANDSRRRRTQVPTHSAIPKVPGQIEVQLQQMRNTLFLNRGDGTFAELAEYAGVGASGWSWGTLALDVDLDGRPDLLIANGHAWDVMDGDTQERQQQGWSNVPWERRLVEFPRLALGNVAFRNRGDLTFEDASRAWGFGTGEDLSHALAAADLDGDGDQDVVVSRLNAPVLVLRNDTPAPRLAVRLRGEPPNTHAVGAVIRVTAAGSLPPQQREITAGGLYLSHSDYLASFATGSAQDLTLEVTWRDGRKTTLTGVRPKRLYEIREAGSGERGMGSGDSTRGLPTPRSPFPTPLFEDVSSLLGGHRHVENRFDDWGRQYLLPDGLSQLGPGLAWFDLDRDGAEDLIVGTGRGGRLAAFRNRGGRFSPLAVTGDPAPGDLTTVLGFAEPDGVRVLTGVSNWEARTPEEMLGPAAVAGFALTRGALAAQEAPMVPPGESAIGPLALADYDGDGRLDLFVGGRALPLRYPMSPVSQLFRNRGGGRFEPDLENQAVLQGIGMVSAAVFADFTGDGLVDLALAREWGSILLLVNAGHGRFAPAPAAWGLDRWTSRWNGLAAGDLDGDGRLDLVATSWGRNMALHPTPAQPLMLAYGPFGARGEVEMLLAQQDARLGGPAPLTDYLRVRLAVPSVASRFPTFAAWADATLDQVMAAIPGGAARLEITTLDHLVLLNRGDRFEASPLPAEAQLAPAFGAVIADFTGAGLEDVFLGQNFSPTVVGVPRYDAGRGLLLRGDGRGGLQPLPGSASGILVYGDQRGVAVADYDADGRLDLAVGQNAQPTLLYHNRGATPGLRVRVAGPSSNPDAIGAQVRIVYADRMGPVREIQAGSGYWSQNGAVQVFGLSGTPTEVWVRWPGGAESRLPVPAGAREVTVTR
ncbi:MAG: FG-GAP-like repeat-containing protein [Gemmatimonadales bacterium]